jgi:hypothetical protein
MNKVAISDMFEIQSSQLALAKQADADTKPFAEKMVQGPSEDFKRIESPGRRRQGQGDAAHGARQPAPEDAG